MTFAELVLAVRDWSRRLPPAQVRAAVERQLQSEEGVEGCSGISVDAVLVMVRMGLGPGMRPVVLREAPETAIVSEPAAKPEAEPEILSAPRRRPASTKSSGNGKAPQLEGKRARALVREQLRNGPKPGVEIEAAAQAADIPKPTLIAAANALGVRTQRGQWWIAG